jgi:hypothetical protein
VRASTRTSRNARATGAGGRYPFCPRGVYNLQFFPPPFPGAHGGDKL